MNPKQLLEEIAPAIKHRCISTSERWHIIYYYGRVVCVPSYENVPPEIVIGEFTEYQVQTGFTTEQWTDIKTNVIKLYKELHK